MFQINFIKCCLQSLETNYLPGIIVDEVSWHSPWSEVNLERAIENLCSKVALGVFALSNLRMHYSLEELRMAYFGINHLHLAYQFRIWCCAKYKLERLFKIQKRAARTIKHLKVRESCRNAFRELTLLTLPCLYMFEVLVYWQLNMLRKERSLHRNIKLWLWACTVTSFC